MELSFGQIFEVIDNYKNRTPIQISQTEVTSPDDEDPRSYPYTTVEITSRSIWSFASRKRKIKYENEDKATRNHFIQLIQKTAHPRIADQIAKDVEGAKITAGKIREIYRKCIASHLDGIRLVACEAKKPSARIICGSADGNAVSYKTQNAYFQFFRKKKREENRAAIRNCYAYFVNEWGKERTDRVLQRYTINLKHLHKKGKPLTAEIVNKLTLGVADYYSEDLYITWGKIQKICQGHASLEILPLHHKRKLAKILETTSDDKLKEALIQQCKPYLSCLYSKLPHPIHELLSKAVFVDSHELELMFQGHRTEGLITGYPPLSMLYFKYPVHVEDKSRLQLYQTIMDLSKRVFADSEVVEKAFNEITAKVFPKFRFAEGMVMPSPIEMSGDIGSCWYLLKKKIQPGGSKQALHFSQLHRGKGLLEEKKSQLADLLLYRSTTSVPSQENSFPTLIDDAWYKGPGYFRWYRWRGIDEENKVLFNNLETPLKVMGHSLGGCHAQFFLVNRIKEGALPNRNIHIIAFDSPAPLTKDSAKLDILLDKHNPRIKADLFFSKEDKIPAAGGSFAKKVNCIVLEVVNKKNPFLKGHPHGLFYYLAHPKVDYKAQAIEAESFSKQLWRKKWERIRKVVGFFLFPPVFTIGYTKRFFLGRVGHPSGIRMIFSKLFKLNPYPRKPFKDYSLQLV